MTDSNNDLQDFQKRVFSEYKVAKAFEESSDKINKGRKKDKSGCLYVPVFLFTDLFVSKIIKSESRKRNYAENKREAKELLKQKEIFERICGMIADTNRADILTEEKFVNELTAALYQSNLARQFVIPENAVLYAMMATKIFNAGFENFCNERQTDE